MAASKNAIVRPPETDSAAQIATYQYLKLEKILSKEKIEDSVENLTEDSAPELADACSRGF